MGLPKPCFQRVGGEFVADRGLGQQGNHRHQRRNVQQVQVVAGIDDQAGVGRGARGLSDRLQQRGVGAFAERGGISAGVDFHAVRVRLTNPEHHCRIWVDEQNDPAPQSLDRGDRRVGQAGLRVVEVPPLLGCERVRGVGNQGALLRPDVAQDRQQPLLWVAFDIEFLRRPIVPHQRRDRCHIGAADVALIGARMHGQPLGAGLQRDAGEMGDVGHAGAARVAQQGELVEVDAETGHARQDS